MTDTTPPATIELPPLDQVAYMVHDLDDAIARFSRMFGPFSTMEADNKGALYKGERHDVDLKLAFGRSGDVEIELIEHVRGESPHKDWIEANGESIFHVRFMVDDVDAKLAELATHGYETIWYNQMPQLGIKYAYTQAPRAQGGHVFELGQGF